MIFYQNCRGVKTKLDELKYNMLNNDCDIIALTETWLNESIYTAEFNCVDRIAFRKDRNRIVTGKSQGGGVLLAVRNNLIVNEVKVFDDDQEALCIRVGLDGNHLLYVVVVYITPNSPSNVYEHFFEKIETFLVNQVRSECMIIGDFNIPSYVDQLSCNDNLNALRGFLAFNNLIQVNQIKNQNGVILDLVIASFDNVRVDKSDDCVLPVDSHHPCLCVAINTKTPIQYCKVVSTTKFNFRKANFLFMYELLKNQNWGNLEEFSDVNMAIDHFYSILNSIFEECVPKSTQTDKRYPVWFDSEIIKLIKLKRSFFLKSKRYKSQYWKSKYIALRSTIKLKIRLNHTKYLSDIENSLKSNPKFFWSYVKSLKDNHDIHDEMVFENQTYSGTQNITEGFAKFFKSVYIDDLDVACNTSTTSKSFFCQKRISFEMIKMALKKVKPNKAIGPDGIPAYILKGCSDYFLIPLHALFNLILRTSTYPDKWKISKVIPIFKTGSRDEIKNYRPISIVCAVSKIFEVIIFDLLFSEMSNRITSCQHGFLPKRSTLTNLITFCQYVHEALNSRSQVDVIFMDMEKAFDRVRHCIILRALNDLDVPSYLVNLIHSYLKHRYQYVQLKGCKSDVFISTSGVPQGSNLGPLLFLAAINSIVDGLESAKGLLFADDFKCFFQVGSIADCEILQNDFCNVVNWCNASHFNLNVSKCSCMSFTLNNNALQFNYKLNDVALNRVNTQKDLGIIFDTALSFSNHIVSKIESAQKIAGFISRNTKNFPVDVSLHLFDSLVAPILEYGSIIWSPQYNVWFALLESVQRKFLKSLYFRKHAVYPPIGYDNSQLLREFNRLSLEHRRIKIDLCMMFKLLRGSVDSPDILSQLPFAIHRINSRNTKIFYLTYPRINLYKNSPIYRMCNVFNLYACDIDIDIICLKQFKKLIDSKLRDE